MITWATTSIRPWRGHGRRPQNAGSDRAPAANIAPNTRSASGRCRDRATASPREPRGAERAVPHRVTTTGFRTSSEPPMPKGSPATRCFTATAPPAASTARRASSHLFVVLAIMPVCPVSPVHELGQAYGPLNACGPRHSSRSRRSTGRPREASRAFSPQSDRGRYPTALYRQ